MKSIRYTADAAKALRRHANRADRLRRAIRDYTEDPAAHANNIRSLVGVDAKRLRVGDFRILFSETADEILLLRIGPRGEIYD
ncbi:type II toxin-antitoxin system RelE family toxin [Roseicella aquatilis]|uniref:Type II toxin-antitoxin system RelE/ParE family toxin n=1 Tax=Roseicella aquatilis TaxID=2527868 RepID=A0A4R4DQS6_9PROT|nr:type II toxin-antitoxin system RelE/ParE family toxin [Roseicella aquatilis]TCZ64494.1 type II toxin-antitoxin system RelE/ParE family toxin [Roseicella aquatilis]